MPDPSTGQQLEVCQVRVAARDRRGDTVYLDLAEWGAAGRAAARCLRKGSAIAFSGELRFREKAGDGGTRQYLSAVGHIEFLGARAPADEPRDDELVSTRQPDESEAVDIPF